jgi:hypothetical protein
MTDQAGVHKPRSLFSKSLARSSGDYLRALVCDFLLIWISLYLSVGLIEGFHRYSILNTLDYLSFSFVIIIIIWLVVGVSSAISSNLIYFFLPRSVMLSLQVEETPEAILQRVFEDERQLTDAERTLVSKLRTITAIDERTARLRFRANLMLYAVGALLIGASIIIVFAGTLTNLDASAVSNVDRITKDIDDAEGRLARLSGVEELKKASAADPSGAGKKLASLTDNDPSLPTSDNGLAAEIDAAKTRLTQSEDLLRQAWSKELSAERGYNDTRYIIATAITRIGVVLVIIFLAQVLIGLYRYNTRLITFYNSRRDFFQIWNGKGATPKELQNLIEPHIDFGKEPKHPLEDIIHQVIAKIHPPTVSIGEATGKAAKSD